MKGHAVTKAVRSFLCDRAYRTIMVLLTVVVISTILNNGRPLFNNVSPVAGCSFHGGILRARIFLLLSNVTACA